jgi:hypothetical protein
VCQAFFHKSCTDRKSLRSRSWETGWTCSKCYFNKTRELYVENNDQPAGNNSSASSRPLAAPLQLQFNTNDPPTILPITPANKPHQIQPNLGAKPLQIENLQFNIDAAPFHPAAPEPCVSTAENIEYIREELEVAPIEPSIAPVTEIIENNHMAAITNIATQVVSSQQRSTSPDYLCNAFNLQLWVLQFV